MQMSFPLHSEADMQIQIPGVLGSQTFKSGPQWLLVNDIP